MPPKSQKTVQRMMEQSPNLSKSQEEPIESGGVNHYKDYTKVFTPSNVVDIMVGLAELSDNLSVLEPSAGLGNILKGIHKRYPRIKWIDYYELNETHATQIFLSTDYTRFKGSNFIEDTNIPLYDRIIANPPFDLDTWLAHSNKMWKQLAPNGILVFIAPKVPILKSTNIEPFKASMKNLKAESHPIENWYTSKDSTKLPIHIIKIRKQ